MLKCGEEHSNDVCVSLVSNENANGRALAYLNEWVTEQYVNAGRMNIYIYTNTTDNC